MIVLLSYLIVFGLGISLGRRHLRPREEHSLLRLAEGAVLGWLVGKQQ